MPFEKVRWKTEGLGLFLALAFAAHLSAAVSGDYQYADNGSSVTITGYTGSGGAVALPATINSKPVTGIGPWAFESCFKLTGVTIPAGVTTIGYGAFCNCTNLTAVTLPNSVTTLGVEAFNSCRSLTSITLPAGLTGVPKDAFSGSGLVGVIIPSGVTSIGDSAFMECNQLVNVTIAASVTNMDATVFAHCKALKNVYFSGNAPAFGEKVFAADRNFTVHYPAAATGWTTGIAGASAAMSSQ